MGEKLEHLSSQENKSRERKEWQKLVAGRLFDSSIVLTVGCAVIESPARCAVGELNCAPSRSEWHCCQAEADERENLAADKHCQYNTITPPKQTSIQTKVQSNK
jgi:hypothetical protein